MANVVDPRMGLTTWTADSDQWPGRAGWNAELTAIFTKTTLYGSGPASARPTNLLGGRFYWATDTKRMFYDDGTAWTEVSPVGDGTAGKPSAGTGNGVFTGASVAGTPGASRVAARVDHTHPQPAWPVNSWNFERNSADVYNTLDVGAGMIPLISGTMGNAPAGTYLLGFTIVLSTRSNATDAQSTANIRLTLDGQNQTEDMRADLAGVALPYTWVRPVVIEDPGNHTLVLAVQVNQAQGAVITNGSHLWGLYLGPIA